MILRELYYTDRSIENTDKPEFYDPENDGSGIRRSYNRRTRLTLRQINQARRADELHAYEKNEELDFVRQMYGIIAQTQMAGDDGMGGM